jgi:hypothetical protein
VLLFDLLLATALLDPLAASREVVREGAQQAIGGRGHGRK